MESAEERVLELERELQSLRLELAAQKRATEQFKQELERQRGGESARLAAVQLEKLFEAAAAPISQLITQNHLLKVEEKPVRAEDIAAVATRLIRVLEDYGLIQEGAIGETVAFDPNLHESLSMEVAPTPGESVIIRLTGISFKGKLLRKAGVLNQ